MISLAYIWQILIVLPNMLFKTKHIEKQITQNEDWLFVEELLLKRVIVFSQNFNLYANVDFYEL